MPLVPAKALGHAHIWGRAPLWIDAAARVPTLPLVGRVDRQSEAKAVGVGVGVVDCRAPALTNLDPHPARLPSATLATLPTRGRVTRGTVSFSKMTAPDVCMP
jgi:hypothetical protein